MRLRNKKTGEIVDFRYLQSDHVAPLVLTTYKNNKPEMYSYNSLSELNAEWEDASEEPKEFYYITDFGYVLKDSIDNKTVNSTIEEMKSIGNYFESLEEAEKAVEKLKAWKRLKDTGFRFKGYTDDSGDLFSCQVIRCSFDDFGKESRKDLNLLFGGEE